MNVSVEKNRQNSGESIPNRPRHSDKDIVVFITDLFMALQSFSFGFRIKICNEVFHIGVECHLTAFLSVAFF